MGGWGGGGEEGCRAIKGVVNNGNVPVRVQLGEGWEGKLWHRYVEG